jgi:hypothetical protein
LLPLASFCLLIFPNISSILSSAPYALFYSFIRFIFSSSQFFLPLAPFNNLLIANLHWLWRRIIVVKLLMRSCGQCRRRILWHCHSFHRAPT